MTLPVDSERRYTVEEYFSVEESSAVRHEFVAGQIFAMAGASVRHNRIMGNLFAGIRGALAGRCEVFASDLRVRTPSGLYTYPDVMVVCGGVELSPTDRLDTVLNPIVLAEILSDSTAAYDRGEKFRHYRSIPTVRDYLLVDQSAARVEHHSRRNAPHADWDWRRYSEAEDVVRLPSLNVDLTLAAIYAGVLPT